MVPHVDVFRSRNRVRQILWSSSRRFKRRPVSASRLAELLAEAGLPSGVFQCRHTATAKAVDVAPYRITDVAARQFRRLRPPIAQHVTKRLRSHGKRVQALGAAP
jgi:malonate-semialdehyde dehydrogenase (acetylating)/methylmalonate-semialdehyde dehydrogenase